VWSATVVLLALLPAVVEGASVAYIVVVTPAETRVFVGVGTNDFDVLAVAFAPDVVEALGEVNCGERLRCFGKLTSGAVSAILSYN
jgi:hypothetical protein